MRAAGRAGVAGIGAAVAAAAYLVWRLAPDVREKPLFEDEAVAGLIAARPVGELLATVMWDRGGAPLHFLLAHAGFWLDASADTLRWLSVAFAVATVLVSYDLGRRLAGPLAGSVAAVVAATSTVLGIYGSFGRMYSLFALAGGLAATLFLRALERRTVGAAVAAAGAAWLLPAVHPYGIIPVAAEAAVALWLWRGRPLRAAVPVGLVALAFVPLLLADLRLTSRFSVGLEGEEALAPPGEAWAQFGRALASFAGGEGVLLAGFVAAAVGGWVVLVRRLGPFAAFAALALLLPPLLFMLLRSADRPGLSPRHLVYALPLWAALIGVFAAHVARPRSAVVQTLAVAAIAAGASLAPPGGIEDPRLRLSNAILGGGPPHLAPGAPAALEAPARDLRDEIRPGDVLFPYSPLFLAALPAAADAIALPYGQARLLLRTVERIPLPARALFVAVPIVPPRETAGGRQSWLVIRVDGPFRDQRSILSGALGAFTRLSPGGENLAVYRQRNVSVLCDALELLGEACR